MGWSLIPLVSLDPQLYMMFTYPSTFYTKKGLKQLYINFFDIEYSKHDDLNIAADLLICKFLNQVISLRINSILLVIC